MTQPKIAGSASLPFKLSAFGVLFTALSVSFVPAVTFALTLLALVVLSKL
jgi:hypothetical protein